MVLGRAVLGVYYRLYYRHSALCRRYKMPRKGHMGGGDTGWW
jgi:hypothetical protein